MKMLLFLCYLSDIFTCLRNYHLRDIFFNYLYVDKLVIVCQIKLLMLFIKILQFIFFNCDSLI